MKNHNLVDSFSTSGISISNYPVLDRGGLPVEDLHTVRITLNNPREHNSYTSDMIKEVILALRAASNDRAAT
jgi:6-oxo-cyclohex-1-ene-carbonyl-CoA hydrolase